MTNVGTKPTFGDNTITIETHILDFDEDLYGRTIQLEFIEKIREVTKFPSLDALMEQLKKDELITKKILTN
jgi:riboflavin kinase/FMN adenylyltransferase